MVGKRQNTNPQLPYVDVMGGGKKEDFQETFGP